MAILAENEFEAEKIMNNEIKDGWKKPEPVISVAEPVRAISLMNLKGKALRNSVALSDDVSEWLTAEQAIKIKLDHEIKVKA